MKQQLVDAIRMLERAGHIDHNGHCSARRDATSFYINSGASVRGALTVDDIVAVGLDGTLVEGTAKPPLEYHIRLLEAYRDALARHGLRPPPGYGVAGAGNAVFSVSSFMDTLDPDEVTVEEAVPA